MLLQPDEVLKKERLGRGAFATVYHAQIKRKLPNVCMYMYTCVLIAA